MIGQLRMAQCRILGVVYTMVPLSGKGGGKYGKYGNYYGYYGKKNSEE